MTGEKIKNYLKEKGITQAHISKVTGINKMKINSILSSKQKMLLEDYLKICKVLDVPVDFFIEGGAKHA